jgi:hypothetical protein
VCAFIGVSVCACIVSVYVCSVFLKKKKNYVAA